MACYQPITAFQHITGGPLQFYERKDMRQLQIACGQCIGCLVDKSRQWAMRCTHEARMHKHNCFITLTFNDDNIPPHNFLDHRYWQIFMKKLREAALSKNNKTILHQLVGPTDTMEKTTPPTGDSPPLRGGHSEPLKTQRAIIRYYMAGEYGEKLGRPHFHACLFGIDFSDKKFYKLSPTGYNLYQSETLDNIWGKGYATIATLNFETAAYTARYTIKKAGQKQGKTIEIINIETGEIIKRPKEYNKMSRNKGIGKEWLKQYYTDVYPNGKVIINGQKSNPPRYYDNQAKTLDPLAWEDIEYNRHMQTIAHAHDNTPERLRVKHHVAKAKLAFLKRNKDFT